MKQIKRKADSDYQLMIDSICRVLEHCVGDGRACPECGKVFVPDGKCERDAHELYKMLKELR